MSTHETLDMACLVLLLAVGIRVPTAPAQAPIIIDHAVVDQYEAIPAQWLAVVKSMLLNYPGESHGRGLLYGLELLQAQNSQFAVNVAWSGPPQPPTDQYLRVFITHFTGVSWQTSTGEEDTWTHPAAIQRIHDHLAHCANGLQNPIDAFAFAWCWDMEWQSGGCNAAGWAGRVYTDFPKTIYTDHWDIETTSPCLRDYLTTWAGYAAAHPQTAIVYTTGPADGATGCPGYQRWLKNNAIRDWVSARSADCLFDYEDILCHNDAGELYTIAWETHRYPRVHPDNAGNYDGGHGGCHVGQNGCLRLGKAAWVMLARLAGWPGAGVLVGDVNCDGNVDLSGINPFVLALANPAAYAAQYPDCPLGNRDIDGDGRFGFDDINPFVALLSNP